ncbi:MAG: Ig-like domain-containing protein [Bacteroidota bacterium]
MELKNIFFAASISLAILSCSSDDNGGTTPTPEPENQNPTVSFVSPTNAPVGGPHVWNTISVELNAADADGSIAKVEFFANGVKEGEATAAPYTFDWDTKNVEDGSVELKATVTDDEGAVVTEAISVNVYNVLLDYDTYEGYFNDDASTLNYIYITSPAPAKEILYIAQVTGSSFAETVQRPDDFDGETFDVHFLTYVKGDMNEGEITTYHSVTPGIFSPQTSTPTDFGNELGTANVTFNNVPEHDYAMIFSFGNTNPINEGAERSFTVFENFDLGYVYLQSNGEGSYLAPPFAVGDHDLLLSEMKTSMQPITFSDAGPNSTASLLVQGHTGPGRFTTAATVYLRNVALNGEAFETNFHVPNEEDDVFDHYYTNARLQANNKTYVHEAYDAILTSMTKMDATLMATNKTMSELDVTATANNDFDFFNMTSQIAASDDFNFIWNSYSADDNVSFPPIPTEVVNATGEVFNASDIAFKDASIVLRLEDIDVFAGYSDYRDVQFGRKTEDVEREERVYVFEVFQ